MAILQIHFSDLDDTVKPTKQVQASAMSMNCLRLDFSKRPMALQRRQMLTLRFSHQYCRPLFHQLILIIIRSHLFRAWQSMTTQFRLPSIKSILTYPIQLVM